MSDTQRIARICTAITAQCNVFELNRLYADLILVLSVMRQKGNKAQITHPPEAQPPE